MQLNRCIRSFIKPVKISVANAACDLLMLGAWTQVMHKIPAAKPIPVRTAETAFRIMYLKCIQLHFFARDDRIYQDFADKRRSLRDACRTHLTKRLQWQMKVMKKVGFSCLPRINTPFYLNPTDDWHKSIWHLPEA